MKPTFFKGVVIGAGTSVLVMTAAAALAGTGVGGIFNLGVTNSVDDQSALVGTVDNGAQFSVRNDGTGFGIRSYSSGGRGILGQHNSTTGTLAGVEGATISTDPNAIAIRGRNTGGGSALDLLVANGSVPPFRVNSSAKVGGLNADLLDGRDSSAFGSSTIYVREMTTNGSANAGGTCPSGDLCYAGGYYCDNGDTLVGGGFDGFDSGTRLVASEPFVPNPQDAWRIKFVNNATEDTIVVKTICLDNPPLRAPKP